VLFGERSLPDNDHAQFPSRGMAVDVVPTAGHSMAIDNPDGLAIQASGGVDIRHRELRARTHHLVR